MSEKDNLSELVRSYLVFINAEEQTVEYERNVWAYDLLCDFASSNLESRGS